MDNNWDEIWVVYPDGMVGVVSPAELQNLIEAHAIIKFQRSDGWAYLTIDPVRSSRDHECPGLERRRTQNTQLFQYCNSR